jgi:hypothetical protein
MSVGPGSIFNTKQRQSAPETSSEFLGFLKDAEEFAVSYRSIIGQTPLQTYGAALVFSPTRTKIKKLFWGQKLSPIQNVSGAK